MLHYKACSKTRGRKIADIAMIIFGILTCIFTSVQTIGVRYLSIFNLYLGDNVTIVNDGTGRCEAAWKL